MSAYIVNASVETVKGDIEGVHYECQEGACYDGYLIPTSYETRDWAVVTCPRCFENGWVAVFE